ncbi:MAG: aminoacyl-tRNA hydrolase [Alphaproteobacteria bacterium]
MRLFVGLGNPGPKHAMNRHNLGFMALDFIHKHHNFPAWSQKFQGQISDGMMDGEKIILLKPQTFMNVSGQSVYPASFFYKLKPEDIVVFHDELDLAPGKVRVKKGGGTAGHNGLKSIEQNLGPEFWRVRLGIGRPPPEDVTNYVLGDFFKSEEEWLVPLLAGTAQYAPLLAKGDVDGYMSKIAAQMPPSVEAATIN